MEVNDVSKIKVQSSKAGQASSGNSLQRSLTSLSADKVNVAKTEAVSVQVEARQSKDSNETGNARKRANNFISLINGVDSATDELQGLVESLDGIVEQAEASDISESRSTVLEKEANEILGAIRDKSIRRDSSSSDSSSETIRFEAEAELEKTLEVIFKESGDGALSLNKIALSPPENIIKTRASIKEAREQLARLRDAVDTAKSQAKELVDTVEVALQNAEASGTTVRDLDSALKLAGSIDSAISQNPDKAAEASRVNELSAKLLDS